ncbi:MAG: hypothetical protein ACXWJK_06735 [Burkholderiaceae bacterium]
MLPHSFIDWWFAPWSYALESSAHLPLAIDRLGKRDGYRLWCKQAGISADLPSHFDTGWADVMCADGAQLLVAARLFAGLMAAREHEQSVLDALKFSDRKWCVGIAATQPLLRCRQAHYNAMDSIETRGLVELARRLKNSFPGLWPRLRLMLSATQAAQVELLLDTAETIASGTPMVRAQRCWRMCRDRSAASHANKKDCNEPVLC